jgi:23S rRNA pseudouridine1911/1915/1917 synthase
LSRAELDSDLPDDDEAEAPEAGGPSEGPGDAGDDRNAAFAWWPPPGTENDGIDWGLSSHLGPDGKPKIIERHLLVTPDLAGLRLDHFLKAQIPRLSRTKIQEVVHTQLRRDTADARASDPDAPESSQVRPLRPNTTVLAHERYTISRPARREPPCPRTFEILHEDDDVLVIDKPAGLPVHASAKFYFNTLTRVMGERFPELDLQICHRLDRETSGILVVAKGRGTSAVVKKAFAQKRVSKTYLAVVHGDPPWPELASDEPDFRIDAPIRVAGVNDPTPLTGVRMLTGPGGLPSLTLVRVLERRPPYSLLRCQPVSGRQHQIRVHLADAGYPIVGDKLYAHGDAIFMAFCDRGITPELAARFLLPRHALHAASITFPHPRGQPLTIHAALPKDLRALLDTAPQTPPSLTQRVPLAGD